MRLIPVLDVLSGRAVHAVGGDRAHYQPLRSILHEWPDPLALAAAIRDRLGLFDLYMADLDAITGAPPSLALYRSLADLGLSLWIDAGLQGAAHVAALLDSGVSTIVAGLETLSSPGDLAAICGRADPSRVVFSVDLRNGSPLGSWGIDDPSEIVRLAVDSGVRRVLVLDLGDVGKNSGVQTRSLLQVIRNRFPQVELSSGGGVRGVEDLQDLADLGLGATLVASALHDGRLGRERVRSYIPSRPRPAWPCPTSVDP